MSKRLVHFLSAVMDWIMIVMVPSMKRQGWLMIHSTVVHVAFNAMMLITLPNVWQGNANASVVLRGGVTVIPKEIVLKLVKPYSFLKKSVMGSIKIVMV